MDATSFELAVSMPREARYADAVRRLAVQAAQYAGCAAGDADPFASTVERAFADCLNGATGPDVPMTFRRASGPLEVLVDGRVLTLAI
jgi:hypothetical protein